ncbi:type IV pilus assembly protein PilM [Patescibacteria group bacterium]|nr:type IV pilus assembly protein PilM [Patescibacteria group bacterium]
MIWNPLERLSKKLSKKFLGIDIGTASIKIVELSRWGERIKLENYGEIGAPSFYEEPFRSFEKSNLLLSSQEISRAVRAVLTETNIKTKEVIFSIPDFSSFFTSLELPPMSKEELPQAVRFEARQHVPLPLSEVTLDWMITEGTTSDHKKENLRVLLVVVPKEVINQYREVAELSQVQLLALEAEVFSLTRSLVREKQEVVAIVDIGAQSTTCSIVEKGVLKITHSFDVSGGELTRVLSKSLNISYNEAEELKRKYGIEVSSKEGSGGQDITNSLLPLINIILAETEKISQNFYQAKGKEVQKVILAGGSALLPGLRDYFAEELKKEIEIADPFADIFSPPILEETLKKIGPSYAIAVGAALKGLE